MMVFEIWKALPEYPFFKVSNAGRVVKLNKGVWIAWLYEVDCKNTIIDPKKDYECPEWYKEDVLRVLDKKRLEMENERRNVK